jgi:hypothetical protein
VPRFKHTGSKPNSMVGSTVKFGAPGDVKRRGGQPVYGKVVDEVWELESGGAPEARHVENEHHWGEYCFFLNSSSGTTANAQSGSGTIDDGAESLTGPLDHRLQ